MKTRKRRQKASVVETVAEKFVRAADEKGIALKDLLKDLRKIRRKK